MMHDGYVYIYCLNRNAVAVLARLIMIFYVLLRYMGWGVDLTPSVHARWLYWLRRCLLGLCSCAILPYIYIYIYIFKCIFFPFPELLEYNYTVLAIICITYLAARRSFGCHWCDMFIIYIYNQCELCWHWHRNNKRHGRVVSVAVVSRYGHAPLYNSVSLSLSFFFPFRLLLKKLNNNNNNKKQEQKQNLGSCVGHSSTLTHHASPAAYGRRCTVERSCWQFDVLVVRITMLKHTHTQVNGRC